MANKTYSDKLRDPRWQRKRLEVLQRDEFSCKLCKDVLTELHIHHKQYLPKTEPWEYNLDYLVTYCKHCHLTIEYIKQFNEPFCEVSAAKYWNIEKELLIIAVKILFSGVPQIALFHYNPKNSELFNYLFISTKTLGIINSVNQ